jgi:hypothetical protein
VVAVAAVVVAAVIALAVAIGGGGSDGGPPPATGAAAIVPADALAYVHLSTDDARPGVKHALALAARFPDYPLLLAALATRIPGGPFSTRIRPWLGKEAALALLNTTSTTAGTLIVLDVADRARARSFLSQIGAAPGATYRGVQLLRRGPASELAFVSHYLVLGQDPSVKAAIDVAKAGSPSLAGDLTYRRAAATEPDGRVLDAYASAAGVRRLLVAQGGLAGAIGALLYRPALAGVSMSLSAQAPGAQVQIHTVLDPALVQVSGAGASSFAPSLEPQLPAGSSLALDVTGLDKLAPRVLNAGAAGGIAGGLGPLLSRLGEALRAEGINTQHILSLFDGETALAIAPGTGDRTPALVIIARTANPSAARAELATLEVPLAQVLTPAPSASSSSAVIPAFTDRQVDGVTVHQLPIASGLELDYAVFRNLVVVSTSLDGIAAVASARDTLARDPSFKATLGARPSRVTSLLFLNFSQLLSLGGQTGLLRGATFNAVRADLEKVRAVGLSSTSGENDSTAELSLQIS